MITWTATNPNEFKGKKLALVFPTSLKEGVNVDDLLDKEGQINIPNTAQLIIDGKPLDSNTVYAGAKLEIPGETKPSELPKEEIPEGEKKPEYLPQTGTDMMKTLGIGAIGASLGGVLGFFFGKKRK